jgi:hypothetical protein
MGPISTSRACRTVSLMLVCLPLVAAAPAVAKIPDSNPAVREAYSQSFNPQAAGAITTKPNVEHAALAGSNEGSSSSSSSAVVHAQAGGTVPAALVGVAVILLSVALLMVSQRRRHRGLATASR